MRNWTLCASSATTAAARWGWHWHRHAPATAPGWNWCAAPYSRHSPPPRASAAPTWKARHRCTRHACGSSPAATQASCVRQWPTTRPPRWPTTKSSAKATHSCSASTPPATSHRPWATSRSPPSGWWASHWKPATKWRTHAASWKRRTSTLSCSTACRMQEPDSATTPTKSPS